ncbi:hypothetical protein BDQ17DRAFT_1331145 [Cyathus striatus]|nr:hypothetical protein BDQ17DRAFT_1331145 [Cyathus striatus]
MKFSSLIVALVATSLSSLPPPRNQPSIVVQRTTQKINGFLLQSNIFVSESDAYTDIIRKDFRDAEKLYFGWCGFHPSDEEVLAWETQMKIYEPRRHRKSCSLCRWIPDTEWAFSISNGLHWVLDGIDRIVNQAWFNIA